MSDDKKPGTGFVRRVTLETLEAFAPLLARTDPLVRDSANPESFGDDANPTAPADPALERTEALFSGIPVRVRNRRPRASRASSATTGATPPIRAQSQAAAQRTTTTANDLPVLVAELPRGSNRWNQANFDLNTYTAFFGATIGTQRNVRLQHVESDSSLGAVETRPTVEVKSRNFRVELQAASGLAYPVTDRPIAVFVQRTSEDFLYRLVLPTHVADHAAVSRLLGDRWHGRADRVRRVITTLSDLAQYWPSSPLLGVVTVP